MGDSEQSIEWQIASFFNEYPLLWAVYALVMLLPIVFIIACIWPSKKKADSVAQRKKTDAPTPDDRVSSGDAKREQGGVPPARESQTRAEREEKPAVVEQTRTEEENSREEEVSLTSEPQPNRTGICPAGAAAAGGVEREIEVEQNEQEGEVEGGGGGGKLAPAESAIISNGAAVLRNGDVTKSSMSDSTPVIKVKEETSPALHNGDIVENGYHDDDDHPVVENGIDHMTVETAEEEGVGSKRWSFPPVLDDFNLMESDVDPTDLEAIFADDRLKEIDLHIQPDSPGLGISIVGGSGSPNGDLPVIIKRVLPKSLAEEDGRLKQGDELIAVNDTLLVGMSKDFAINALSNMHGDARLLVLQEY